MRKVISLGMCIIMGFLLMIPVVAVGEKTDVDTVLRERGLPQIYLDHLSDSAKESLYARSDLEFEGATITTYNQTDGSVESYDIAGDGIAVYNQIPAADLNLTWGIFHKRYTDIVHVVYSYQWNRWPKDRYEDQIAVTWDSSKFQMVDNSFYKIDQYSGKRLKSDGTLGPVETVTNSREFRYAKGSATGVTWYAKLRANESVSRFAQLKQFGHGEFDLKAKSGGFTTTLYGHYVHNKSSSTVTINFPNGLGDISIGVGSSYGEAANQRTYTFRKDRDG